MQSSELPVTEWWDPEWDVYDVPGSPYDHQAAGAAVDDITQAHFDAWWTAYDHNSEIAYIMTGQRWYAPENLYQHQLTSGLKPLPPCSCRYGLHPTIWCPTHLIDVLGVGRRGAAYTFQIDPWCPHHGIPGAYEGRQQAYREMEAEEAEYWTTLDEHERRGL